MKRLDMLTESRIKTLIRETVNEVLNEYGNDPKRPDGPYNMGRLHARKSTERDHEGMENVYKTFHKKIEGMGDDEREKMIKAYNRGRYDQEENDEASDGFGRVPADARHYERPHLGPISKALRKANTSRAIRKNLNTYAQDKQVKDLPRRHKVH